MTMVVEDGTGKPNANSYVSEAMLDTYCDDRAIKIPAGDVEAALIRSTQYIEGRYRGRWPGARVKYRGLQSLSWPRFSAYADDGSRMIYRGMPGLYGSYADDAYAFNHGYLIQPNEIPIELIQATCEAAILELASPGALQPVWLMSNRTIGVKAERAGDTEFEYFGAREIPPFVMPIVTVIESILTPILLTRTDMFGARDRTG